MIGKSEGFLQYPGMIARVMIYDVIGYDREDGVSGRAARPPGAGIPSCRTFSQPVLKTAHLCLIRAELRSESDREDCKKPKHALCLLRFFAGVIGGGSAV